MNAPPPSARAEGMALSWLRVRAVARRHAYVLWRSPHRLFDVTLWPCVDVLLFGSLAVFVNRAHTSEGGQAAGYLLAGIVLWHVVYQSQIALSTGWLEETWTRNVLNLMVTPIREWEYVAGVVLFGLLKLVFALALVVVAATAFFSFDLPSLGVGLIPVAAILLFVGWSVALFVTGMVLRFGSGAEALAWGIMFVLLPLSGIFYPVHSLPAVVRPLAIALPTTHAFTALHALVDHRGIDWTQLGIAAVSATAMFALALVYVTRMLALFRRRGYITRYS